MNDQDAYGPVHPLTILLTLLLLLPAGCDTTNRPEGLDADTMRALGLKEDVVFQPGVRYLTPAQSATATFSGDTLIFPVENNPWLGDVTVGDVLWSPRGRTWQETFARRVEEKAERGDRVAFQTRATNLNDLFVQVDIRVGESSARGNCPATLPGASESAATRSAVSDSMGRYPAYRAGRWGYIDQTGRWAIAPRFYRAGPFAEGLGAVQPCENGPWGYVDASGAGAIPAEFERAEAFSERLASVTGRDERPGVIDKSGQYVIRGNFHEIDGFSGGLARAEPARTAPMSHTTGFIDYQGAWSISPLLRDAGNFAEGLAPASREMGAWGFIDPMGEWAIGPRFKRARPFADGLAPVKVGFKEWTYIDKMGSVALGERFEDAWPFSDGLALVERNDRYEYINTRGETIITGVDNRWFCRAESFRGALAQVYLAPEGTPCGIGRRRGNIFIHQNAVMAYIDRSGAIVYERSAPRP